MLKITQYDATKGYDDNFAYFFQKRIEYNKQNNDDSLLIFVGETGSGKSNLMLHAVTIIDPLCSGDEICLTKEKFAKKQYEASKKSYDRKIDDSTNSRTIEEKLPMLVYDEADLQKRNHSTKYVKDVISLYFKNRCFNIMHIWCWPSLESIEKTFIQERILGVFFCTKEKFQKGRIYCYYTKNDLVKLKTDLKDAPITNTVLRKSIRNYASFVGWHNQYKGNLIENYHKIKMDGALDAASVFLKNHGENTEIEGEVAGQRPINAQNLKSAQNWAIHYNMSASAFRLRVHKSIRDGIIPNIVNRTRILTLNDEQAQKVMNYCDTLYSIKPMSEPAQEGSKLQSRA